ncbi:MAG: hypothetical protein DMG05_19015 [Acidobacteria bacterium]|nr:MAG: hypothetical protein DMG05_19015 [Acidobacteriota bacterium]
MGRNEKSQATWPFGSVHSLIVPQTLIFQQDKRSQPGKIRSAAAMSSVFPMPPSVNDCAHPIGEILTIFE